MIFALVEHKRGSVRYYTTIFCSRMELHSFHPPFVVFGLKLCGSPTVEWKQTEITKRSLCILTCYGFVFVHSQQQLKLNFFNVGEVHFVKLGLWLPDRRFEYFVNKLFAWL